MRISEWSSDVCSSDLSTYKALFDQPSQGDTKLLHGKQRFFRGLLMPVSQKLHDPVDNGIGFQCEPHPAVEPGGFRIEGTWQADRKRVVSGKRVSGRVDIGGRGTMNKKKI